MKAALSTLLTFEIDTQSLLNIVATISCAATLRAMTANCARIARPCFGPHNQVNMYFRFVAARLCKMPAIPTISLMNVGVARTPLFKTATSESGLGHRTPPIPVPAALLEPALTIIGHEHKVYYACPSSAEENGNITILGLDKRLADQLGTALCLIYHRMRESCPVRRAGPNARHTINGRSFDVPALAA
jgi:hypothetical protein